MANGSLSKPMGIDVSLYQTNVDWPAVQQGEVSFVFVKATDGAATVDPLFQSHWPGAKAVQLPRAPYHFFEPLDDLVAQAALFANTVQADPGELPPILDLEEVGGVDNDTLIFKVGTWLHEVQQRLGRAPMVYTSATVWNNHMQSAAGHYPDWAQNYKLWVAQYPYAHDGVDIHTHPLPPLPDLPTIRAFANQLMPASWPQWTFWQYTGRGAVNGIDGFVDQDLYNGTLDELRTWAGGQPVVVDNTNGSNGNHQDDAITGLTNQAMINIFYAAAKSMGSADGWALVEKAGLEELAVPKGNNLLPYTGPSIAKMNGLTNDDRTAVQNALDAARRRVATPQPGGYLNWEYHAVPGLHGPADPGSGWVQIAFDAVKLSKVQAVKVLAPDVQHADLVTLHGNNGGLFIMARLFNDQLKQRQADGTPEGAGRWFANQVADPGDGNSPMNRAYNSGVRYFEVHNEPNLPSQGLGANWADGAAFGRFFQTVVAVLRPRYPEARFGFPGLSPGPVILPDRPITAEDFWQQAQAAVAQADFVGCHVYWGQMGIDTAAAVAQLKQVCDRFPGQRILCTEFSNNDPAVTRETKADQYAQFYQACQALPANLGAMFAFTLSWSSDKNNEGFLVWNAAAKAWTGTPMAQRLGGQMP